MKLCLAPDWKKRINIFFLIIKTFFQYSGRSRRIRNVLSNLFCTEYRHEEGEICTKQKTNHLL